MTTITTMRKMFTIVKSGGQEKTHPLARCLLASGGGGGVQIVTKASHVK